ncbi:60S ribosomal eL36 domain-containing protein [Aspergillus homomorphus CBS 101889]|uniref:60S ribosomal protein L36 n=1 Tax=Aspergillus homomorphus (strain CBS 101889) TaxID=1450537 RepID=A0A395HNI7_ASPHC|nr:hypothetical protein BO97DRAFT_408052 [Aspergillus homomorphus CBS 101889]RAL08993.1 hypothetical protein BO97DRAFT_408052 [Aspergillus homomorphus CBS 101889]
MAQERSGIVVGLNKGHKTTPLNTPKTRVSRTKGQSSRRTAFVREIAREVVGLAPYERRIIELLRNTQDKRARKLAKKRVRFALSSDLWFERRGVCGQFALFRSASRFGLRSFDYASTISLDIDCST